MGEGTGMDGRAAGKTQGHSALDEGQEGWEMVEGAGGGCGSWWGCIIFWYPTTLENHP